MTHFKIEFTFESHLCEKFWPLYMKANIDISYMVWTEILCTLSDYYFSFMSDQPFLTNKMKYGAKLMKNDHFCWQFVIFYMCVFFDHLTMVGEALFLKIIKFTLLPRFSTLGLNILFLDIWFLGWDRIIFTLQSLNQPSSN